MSNSFPTERQPGTRWPVTRPEDFDKRLDELLTKNPGLPRSEIYRQMVTALALDPRDPGISSAMAAVSRVTHWRWTIDAVDNQFVCKLGSNRHTRYYSVGALEAASDQHKGVVQAALQAAFAFIKEFSLEQFAPDSWEHKTLTGAIPFQLLSLYQAISDLNVERVQHIIDRFDLDQTDIQNWFEGVREMEMKKQQSLGQENVAEGCESSPTTPHKTKG